MSKPIDKPDSAKSTEQDFLAQNMSSDELQKKIEQYTIFLVEDDSDDRRQAMQELRKSPHVSNVHCFESGEKLLAHFVNEGYYSGNLMRLVPTIIILDVHIPGASGIDVLRSLKDHPLTEDMPVIILTGDPSNKQVMDAYKFKANAFISKPLNLAQIHDVISTGWGWPNSKIPQ